MVLFIVGLTSLSHRTLLLLEPMLLVCRQLEVAVLEGALVWTQSRVRRRQQLLQLVRDIVRLESEAREVVEVLAVSGPRRRLEYDFFAAGGEIFEVHDLVPLTVQFVLVIARLERSLQLELARATPTGFLEHHVDLVGTFAHSSVALLQVARDGHGAHMLDIHSSNDDVVDVDVWPRHVKKLVVVW